MIDDATEIRQMLSAHPVTKLVSVHQHKARDPDSGHRSESYQFEAIVTELTDDFRNTVEEAGLEITRTNPAAFGTEVHLS